MFIKSNLASLNSRRHLNQSVIREAKSSQRLGSGFRINQAGDDAAGLSIATRMEASVRGSTKAIQSNQQSISLLQTAESVLNEQTTLLQRMRELTVQSLNGTYQEADRQSLQEEVSQFTTQFDKSAEVKFNQNKIFDHEVTLYSDDELDGAGKVSKFFKSKNANRMARQSFNQSKAGVSQEALLDGEITITNREGEVFQIRGTQDVDDQVSTTLNNASAIAKAKVINEFSEETGLTAIANETVAIGNESISATNLDSQNYFSINDHKFSGFDVQVNDADGTLISTINAASEDTGVIAHLNANSQLILTAKDGRNIEVETEGTVAGLGFDNAVWQAELTLRSTETFDWSYSDEFIDAKVGYLFSNLIPLTKGTASEANNSSGADWHFIGEGSPVFVDPLWQGHEQNNIVLSGKYNGDIASAVGNRFHIEVDTVSGGVYLATLAAEANGESKVNDYIGPIAFAGNGTYIFASNDVVVPPPTQGGLLQSPSMGSGNIFIFQFKGATNVDSDDTDGDGVDAFQFTAPVGDLAPIDFTIGLGYDETVDTIDISTLKNAERALFTIDLALEEIAAARSEYGAMINFYESSTRSLESERVNLSAAKSQIKDTDFAIETAALSQSQITKQAGISILAQANAQPSLALDLLA